MSRKVGLDIVVPMAGRGSRFSEAGYREPKPLIDVDGEPMIRRVINNLRPGSPHRFIFLVLSDHLRDYQLEQKLKGWAGDNAVCVPVAQITQGAACTVLLAESHLRSDRDLLIANSDQVVDASADEFANWARRESLDGAIMVFEDDDPKWSFAKVNDQGLVTQVAEKVPISNLATVGIYYFSSGESFTQNANSMITKNIRVNNEFYVCPVYNELIAAGGKIKTWKIDKLAMHGLGTPDDLRGYLKRIGR